MQETRKSRVRKKSPFCSCIAKDVALFSLKVVKYHKLYKAVAFYLFLSSPLAGKRDKVVTILVRCMCVRPCIRACIRASMHPSGFVWTITCTVTQGFQNNLAQLLPLRRRSAI